MYANRTSFSDTQRFEVLTWTRVEQWGNSTDSDEDTIGNIGVGSPIMYMVYSDADGACWSKAQHEKLFESTVAFLARMAQPFNQDVLPLHNSKGFPSALLLDEAGDSAYLNVKLHQSFGVQRISLGELSPRDV